MFNPISQQNPLFVLGWCTHDLGQAVTFNPKTARRVVGPYISTFFKWNQCRINR